MRPVPRKRRGLVMVRQFESENEVSAKSSSSAESSELETSNQKIKRKPLGLLSGVTNMGNTSLTSQTEKLSQSQQDSEVDDEPRKELLFSPPRNVRGKTNKQSAVKGKVESSSSSCLSSPPQKLRMRGNKQVFTKKPAAPSGVESSASSQQSPMVSPLMSPRPPSSQSSVASLPPKPRGRPKKTAAVESSASSILSSPQSVGSKKSDAIKPQSRRSSRRHDSVKTTVTGGATESSVSSCYSPVKKKSLKQQKLEAIQDSPGQRKSIRLASSEKTKQKEEVVVEKTPKQTPKQPTRKRSAATSKAAAAEKHAKKYKPLNFKESDDFPPLNLSSRRDSASSSRLDESDQPKKVPVYRLEPKPEHVMSTVDDIYELDFDSSEAKPIKKRQKRTRKVAPVKKKVQPPLIVDDKEEKRTLRKRSLPAVVEEGSPESDDDQLVEEEPLPKKAKPGRPSKQQPPKGMQVQSEEEPPSAKDPVSKSGRTTKQQPLKKADVLSEEEEKSKANSALTNSNVVLQTTPLLKQVAQRLREEVQLNPKLAETAKHSLEEELVPSPPQEEEFLPPPSQEELVSSPPQEEELVPTPPEEVEEDVAPSPQEQERISPIIEEPHHLSYGTDEPEEGENLAEESAEMILAGAGQDGTSMIFPPSVSTAPELGDCFGFDEVVPTEKSRKAPVVVESTPLKRKSNRVPMAAADFISPVAKPTRTKTVEKLPVITETKAAVPINSTDEPIAPPASKKRTSCSRPARLDGKAALRLATLAQPVQKREPRSRKGKKIAPAPSFTAESDSEEEDHLVTKRQETTKVVVADPETHFTQPPKVSYSRKNRGKVFGLVQPKKPVVAAVYESDEEEEEGSEEEYLERASSRNKKTNKGKKEMKTTPKKKKATDEHEEEYKRLQAEYDEVEKFDLSTLLSD